MRNNLQRALLAMLLVARAFAADPPAEEPWLPVEGRPGGYVGSASCKSCHTDEHASWHRSYHRTMTQYATPEAVQANFNNVKLEFRGENFLLEKKDDQFWVNITDQPAPDSKQIAEPIRLPIGMITGSHHMQVFWLPTGAGNGQLGFPFTWLNEDKRWVPRETTFLRDPKLPPPKEVWNMTCVRCHSTGPQPRPDREAEGFRTRLGEMGISCEACHGPGGQHIEFQKKLALEKPATKPRDPHITHPGKLPHDRASQICGQCHSMKFFDSTWMQDGFAYRPGDDLEKTTPVMRPTKIAEQPFLQRAVQRSPGLLDDFFWSDGMIRVSGRDYNGLIESPCFQKGKLSCMSCHSMHESAPNDQLAAGMENNKACLQCHEKFSKDISAHTHHTANSSGSLCYNCHMPHTTYGLMKALRSHQISNPTVSESITTGRPNACNLCHLDKTLDWTAQRMKEWFKTDSPTLNEEHKKTPAGALWALKGDAGQRALAAWHFGWKPAQEISGTNWPAPFLAPLLNDSYAAVRYIAARSLKTLPGFADLKYDFVHGDTNIGKLVTTQWETSQKTNAPAIIPTLLKSQDQKPLHLRE